MKIEYGTVEFFSLESLQKTLNNPKYDKMGLFHLDKMRIDIHTKLEVAKAEHREKVKNAPSEDIWSI